MTDRNAESHFGHVETTDIRRSIFPLEFRNLSTCNAGDLIPFLAYSDLLPGDTIKVSTSAVVRMQTPLNPTMDDAFVDTYYFLIPHRLVWDHWKEFMGENKDSAWVSSTQYQVPLIHAPSSTGVKKGTVADYMGIPKGIVGIDYQALPFRAYVMTYNTWFRNQNLIAPAALHTDDTDRNGNNTVAELGGNVLKVGKIADYFTTCLPDAQKQLPGFPAGGVTMPLGTTAPVLTTTTHANRKTDGSPSYALSWAQATDNSITTSVRGVMNNQGVASLNNTTGTVLAASDIFPDNLYTDLTNATAATINALRLSFQIQKLFERMASHGSRFFEILKGEFGVSPNLGYLQEPEYCGGKRTPLNLTQIVQNSSTTGSGTNLKELGMTGGMSHTVLSNEDFTKSIQEHSILLGLMCIRQYHTYQQGLDRMWSRRDKLDYYTPILAHLGEQPVYKKEIMATGTSANDNAVFGYQERWGEYKYGKHIITGEMNSTYTTSLDVWHYGDYYASQPTLAQNWFEETPDYIDRTIAVAHTTSDQFKFDIVTNIIATRPMPVYCTPGLIDHF